MAARKPLKAAVPIGWVTMQVHHGQHPNAAFVRTKHNSVRKSSNSAFADIRPHRPKEERVGLNSKKRSFDRPNETNTQSRLFALVMARCLPKLAEGVGVETQLDHWRDRRTSRKTVSAGTVWTVPSSISRSRLAISCCQAGLIGKSSSRTKVPSRRSASKARDSGDKAIASSVISARERDMP